MKSKIKILVIGIVIIFAAVVYSFVDKTVSIYDVQCDTSDFQAVTLEKGIIFSQTFQCTEEYLDGISMKITADNVPDNSLVKIHYNLTEVGAEKESVQGEVSLEELKSGSFFKLRFERISGCEGKEYVLQISLEECPVGNVHLFYTPGVETNTKLAYDSEAIDGTQVMRTLTHRFDVETFIVTLVFDAYITLFMRWLYKLFQ